MKKCNKNHFRTFSYVYGVLGGSESPKRHFCAFGAGLVKSRSPDPPATPVRPRGRLPTAPAHAELMPRTQRAGYLGACGVHTPGAMQTPHPGRPPATSARVVFTPREPCRLRTPGAVHLGYLGAKGG